MTIEEITENIKAMCDEAIESDGTLLYINTETAETIRTAIEALSANEGLRCALAGGRKCFAQGYDFTWCITCPHISEKDRQLVNHAVLSLPSAEAEWIPCSDRLPKAEDMYQPPEQRYLCQLEAHGERKFCVLSRLKGAVSPFWDWYGIAVYDSEVTAWMPLPTPYKGGDTK